MGIPSPLIAPIASPSSKLKQLSPELPLQAVQEIEDEAAKAYELLPPASIDLKASQGLTSLKANSAWADCKDSEASDSGDEQDSKSKSTDLPRDNESMESPSTPRSEPKEIVAKESPKAFEPRVASTSRPGDLLRAKGVSRVDASSLMPAGTSVVQMLCRIWRDGSTGMSVVPCMGDDIAEEGEFEVFWCFMQPQMDGTALLQPCTDAAACGVTVDASGSSLDSVAEVVGAPERPPKDAYAPVWIYGAQWPHCAAPTTLMLSSLPTDLLQEDLIEILDKEGFSGFYDFLYLPSKPDQSRNQGFALVNLTRHEYGLALSAAMHGKTSWCGSITSSCQVSWSPSLQGLPELIKHYRNHPARHESVPEDMRPTFFSGGWPRPFPPEAS
jgi:hypothetical protein